MEIKKEKMNKENGRCLTSGFTQAGEYARRQFCAELEVCRPPEPLWNPLRKAATTITAVITVMLLLFTGCKNDISVVKSLTVKEKSPTETAIKMHLYLSESGIVKNELVFEEINKYELPEPYSEYPKGIEVHSYNANRKKEITLTANYAKNYEAKKIMEVKYNVIITNHKTGEIIETEQLVWDMEKHIIYSNTQIKQTKSDGSVYIGDRFESDENMNKYTIFNPKIIRYADE